MRLLIILFLSIFVSNSAFSQTNKFGDKKVEKWLKQADKYLPDFHRDSVISVYPIYEFSSPKSIGKSNSLRFRLLTLKLTLSWIMSIWHLMKF